MKFIALKDDVLSTPDRSFASLMELYENNYIYIRRLIPDLARLDTSCRSIVSGTPDLHLRVIERCVYTTTVELSHQFGDVPNEELIPDVYVRVYHDARAAEVLADSPLQHFRVWGDRLPPDPRSLSWRWSVNRFLNRWLRYCLGEGHCFSVGAPD